MGVIVGLLFGIGVFFLWWSFWTSSPTPARRRSGWADRARDVLVLAGVEDVTLKAVVGVCLGLGGIGFLGALAMSRSPQIAVCFAAIVGWAPVALVRAQARRRRVIRRELWPEAVDNIASGVRAGLSLPEAVTQLGERGPEPLRPAFVAFGQDYRASGRFGECLDRLKDRLADPVGDRICEALRLSREVGGSELGRLLRSLSAFLRQDARTRAELEARQSWTVNGARLAVAAPWGVLALLATRPESVQAYNSAAGSAVLAVGAVLSVVAYRLMLRIGRLPEDMRVLR
jgi:tight adherence protein B